jgi:hypothetical protein
MLTEWARYEGVTVEEKKMEAKVAFPGMVVEWQDVDSGEVKPPTWPNRVVDLSHYWPSYPEGSYAFVRSEASLTKSEEAAFITFVENRMMDAHVPMDMSYAGL